MCCAYRYFSITAAKISRTDHWHSTVLNKSAIYEHKCLENIKKLYKQPGKCDDQQQFKDILESAIVSTPGVFTDNSPIYPITS